MAAWKSFLILIGTVTAISGCSSADPELPKSIVETFEVQGELLSYWVAEANAAQGPQDLDKTVSALAEAVAKGVPKVKTAAADALAVLGPQAKAALPTLLGEFDHELNWVRASCQAAVGSMGKEAVPSLTEFFEQNTGGPRNRAAFVLGSIGADAKPAIPVIVRIMEEESPIVQERFKGVLNQIDPDQFEVTTPVVTGRVAEFGDATTALSRSSATTDWPQFHGPGRDSICRDEGLLQEWPSEGPELLWTLEGLGNGYSSVAIVDGVIFTMGDRADGDGEAQCVIAYNLQTQKELWATPIGPTYSDGGPRSTPAIDNSRVYIVGTEGDVVCLDAASGEMIWRRKFDEDFGSQSTPGWKFCESPLVDGEQLICTPGGPDATMVALDKANGDIIWKCAVPDLGSNGGDSAGYSSPVVAEIRGVRQYVHMIGRGLIGVDAATGRFLWGYNRIANTVANVTPPVVRGDYVFASTAYNTGSVLLEISRDGDEFSAEEVYFLPSREFQNHHGGVVLVGNYVYGGHGPNRGEPTCIDLATGELMWQERSPARGSASVIYADGHLVFRYDRGEVLLIEATPDELKIKGHFQAPEDDGPAWAHPVIHQGKLYLRHANLLMCYDIRAL